MLLMGMEELFVVISVAANTISSIGPSVAFSWHPILMCMSVIIFMTEGINLMWFNSDDISDLRDFHGMTHFFTALCALCGYIAIVIAHYPDHMFSSDASPARQLHMCVGYLVLLLLVVQVCAGCYKYHRIVNHQLKEVRWHGILGPVLHVLALMNIVIAMSFEQDLFGATQIPLIFLVIVISGVTLCLRWSSNRHSVLKISDQEPFAHSEPDDDFSN